MERTLAIIKPDGVVSGYIGEVVRRIESEKLRIVAMRMEQLDARRAEGFYYVHRDRPFFGSLVDFMTSGPVLLMVLEGDGAIAKWRKLMGATDPKKAERATIRKDLATSMEKNVAHGSDAPEAAAFEINYFFNGLQIFHHDREKVLKSGGK